MIAISLYQPWATAWCMRPPLKVHETRGWKVPFKPPPGGVWIAVHAALRKVNEREISPEMFAILQERFGTSWRSFPRGGVVGKVFVDRVDTTEHVVANSMDAADLAFGNFAPGRQAWHTTKRMEIAPFCWSGRQKWFEVPDDMMKSPDDERP